MNEPTPEEKAAMRLDLRMMMAQLGRCIILHLKENGECHHYPQGMEVAG